MRRALVVGLLVLSACAGPTGEPVAQLAEGVTLTQVTGFGSNPGNLRMYEYLPSGLPAGAPLVVAMHGCTESAPDARSR